MDSLLKEGVDKFVNGYMSEAEFVKMLIQQWKSQKSEIKRNEIKWAVIKYLILKTSKMCSIILVNDELVKLIKKAKLQTIEEVSEPDNVNGGNVENFVIENFVVISPRMQPLFEDGRR